MVFHYYNQCCNKHHFTGYCILFSLKDTFLEVEKSRLNPCNILMPVIMQ